MIGLMVSDLIEETKKRIARFAPADCTAVRRLGQPLVAFSPAMRQNDAALKAFLFQHMYRHYDVNRMASKARRVVKDLYSLLVEEPECLPPAWQAICDGKGNRGTARAVADYIAGMTDRNALDEHRSLFDLQEKP